MYIFSCELYLVKSMNSVNEFDKIVDQSNSLRSAVRHGRKRLLLCRVRRCAGTGIGRDMTVSDRISLYYVHTVIFVFVYWQVVGVQSNLRTPLEFPPVAVHRTNLHVLSRKPLCSQTSGHICLSCHLRGHVITVNLGGFHGCVPV
jgi:hypothetical protein